MRRAMRNATGSSRVFEDGEIDRAESDEVRDAATAR